jgi:hypothetical protein
LITQYRAHRAILVKEFAKTMSVSVLVIMVITVVYHISEKAIAQVTIPYPYNTYQYPYQYSYFYPYPYNTYSYPYPYTDQQYYNYNYYYNSPTVTSNNAYTDSLGRIHIVGQVTNYSTSTAQNVQVLATLYDINNNIIISLPSVTNPQDILPSQQALFDIIISPTNLQLPQQVNHYSLVVYSS